MTLANHLSQVDEDNMTVDTYDIQQGVKGGRLTKKVVHQRVVGARGELGEVSLVMKRLGLKTREKE